MTEAGCSIHGDSLYCILDCSEDIKLVMKSTKKENTYQKVNSDNLSLVRIWVIYASVFYSSLCHTHFLSSLLL